MAGIPTSLYLLTYNSIQAFGWAVALFRLLISNFTATGAYASAGDLICLLQSIAFVEVVHGALGLVTSGVLNPLMQWGGRTHFVLAVVRNIVEVQELPAVFITFTAWTIADKDFGICTWTCFADRLLLLVRYTAFIVLYPIGLVGEMWVMYQALPFVRKKNLYANFFAALPFSYYNFLWVVLLGYPFGWFNLFLHMLKQRRSKLGKQNIKKKRN